MRLDRGPGQKFDLLLREAIVELKVGGNSSLVARRILKSIDEFELGSVGYMEVVSYWMLSKVYYLEEKCKQMRGVGSTRLCRQKGHLL